MNLMTTYFFHMGKQVGFYGKINYSVKKSAGGNPILKKLAVIKLIELKDSLKLCDIWQTRNPKSKTFNFWQCHFLIELKDSLKLCEIWQTRNPKSKTFNFWQCHFSGIL